MVFLHLPLYPKPVLKRSMHWLLLLSILPLVSARNIRDFRRQEEEPFDVNTDLFSHLLSLVPPDSNDIEDLKVTTSRRFTGPTSPGLVTAKPPGYSPMPPGFNDERERELVWKGSHQPDISQPKSENFQMAEIDANRDDSNDKVEEEEPDEKREERLFIKEVTDASKALELFTTTVSYDQDEVVLALEGSGLFEEAKKLEDKKENATSREGSGKAFEDSKEEIAFLVGLPKTKVSGEVGMEEDFARKWKRRKTISVDTFLLNSAPSLGIEERLRSAENSNNTEPLRGAVEGCPVPELCAVNCFVTIDSHGCQICQCLWQALACEKDSDCPEASQHCDLGKCDCADGFLQDMTRSGMCKVADATALGAGGLPFKGQEEESSTRIKKGKKARKHLRRMRRAAQFGEKPRSAERLQWPGSCDAQNHCPPPLFCIRGDCWQLPDKPIRRKMLRDQVPDSFLIQSDDNWEMESDLQHRLFHPTRSRALARFVGKAESPVNREMLERTTVSALEGQPNSLFEMRKSTIAAETPQLAPSIVTELYTSTHSWKMSTAEEEGLPPSPPPEFFMETTTQSAWPEVPSDAMAKAFTKMIELPTEQGPTLFEYKNKEFQVLKPKPRKENERRRNVESTTAAATTLDPIEFPFSSQLDSLERDGFKVEPPLALSATPTSKEVESHDQFVRALDEQKRRVEARGGLSSAIPFQSTQPTASPVFPTLTPERNFPLFLAEPPIAREPAEGEQKPGVWYMMSSERKEVERRRSPISHKRSLPSFAPGISPRRPVKVNGIVGGKLEDECSTDSQCGTRYRCCIKRWCDTSGFCSTARYISPLPITSFRFCLPSCDSTKTLNRRVGLMDLVDD